MTETSVHDMDALASIAEDDCLYVEAGDGSYFGKVDVSVLRSEIQKQRHGANFQTGTSYTLQLSDAGKVVELANASPITLTIPSNTAAAFPVNTVIELVQGGAGAVTIGITDDTLNGATSITNQWNSVLLWKRTATVWVGIPGGLSEAQVDARVELYQPTSGTFTPTLQDSSFNDAEGQTYTDQDGQYRVIGDLVFFWLRITMSSLGTLAGEAYIAGLPFTVGVTAYNVPVTPGFGTNLNLTAADPLTAIAETGTTRIKLMKWNATTGPDAVTAAEVSADGRIIISGAYLKAA